MEFKKLDDDLEEKLANILKVYDGECALIDSYDSDAEELEKLGYFTIVSEYISGEVLVKPKRKGLKYFDKKKAWLADIKVAALASADISNFDLVELRKIAAVYLENGGNPVSECFDSSDSDETTSIRKLDRLGYLKVFYAGDDPYVVSVTVEGLRRVSDNDPGDSERPSGWFAKRIAGLLGTFTGAAIKEIND